jgi:hypothetical protein
MTETCETCDALKGNGDSSYVCAFNGDVMKANEISVSYCAAWMPNPDYGQRRKKMGI